MGEVITEALLEMHFHRAVVDSFKARYGANFLKLLKPSPKQEAWVGFDQGWARTSLTTQELFQELKSSIHNNESKVEQFYFGYFLQFKAVERMERSSRLKPVNFNTPYFRCELSLSPNPTTGISQHETLIRLNGIGGASVVYACGMLFDIADIWAPPSTDKLRCVDVSTAPSGWTTNQRHFIAFQTELDPSPLWCSEPVKGKSLSFDEWISGESQMSPKKMTGAAVVQLIDDAINQMRIINKKQIERLAYDYKRKEKDTITSLLPASFTILEFEPRTQH